MSSIGPLDVTSTIFATNVLDQVRDLSGTLQAFFARNVWPEAHPELRFTMEAAYQDFERLSAALLRIFAVALQQHPDFFADKIDAHASNMQVANYSSLLVPPKLASASRKKAHVDSGTFTILLSDEWSSKRWRVRTSLILRPADCTNLYPALLAMQCMLSSVVRAALLVRAASCA